MIEWFRKQFGFRKTNSNRRAQGDTSRWVKQTVAALLFGAICLTFVFFGMDRGSSPGAGGAAAEVNGTIISVAQFRRHVQQTERYYSQIFGERMDMFRKSIPLQAMDALIKMEIIAQQGFAEGIWGTDEEVRYSVVNDVPEFWENGRFRKDLYYNLLEANRLTPNEFESDLRRQSLSRRMRRIFENALTPSQATIESEVKVRNLKINLEYLALQSKDLVAPDSLNPTEVSEFSSKSTAEIERYYTEHKKDYVQPEKVRARHILIKFKAGDGASEEKALKQIKEISAELNSGNFEKLAKKHSEDEGSKVKGGDLGFFARGQMVPPFEEVAFSAAKGTISQPVKSPYGYHLIEVLEKNPAVETSLADASDSIARTLLAKNKATEVISGLNGVLKEQNLEKAKELAARFKMEWKETGFFNVGQEYIPQVGSGAEVVEVVGRLNPNRKVSEKAIHQGDKYFIVLFKELKQEAPQAADDPVKMKEELARTTGNEAFDLWLESATKKVSVVRNERLIRGDGSIAPTEPFDFSE